MPDINELILSLSDKLDHLISLLSPSASSITVGDWLCQWVETYKRPYLRPNSVRSIEIVIRNHIPSEILRKSLTAVTVLDVDRLLLKTSGRTRKYTYQVLYNAFGKAYQIGILSDNIMLRVEPVRHQTEHGSALTYEERMELLSIDHPLKLLFRFYLLTGCRRSEALWICWDDVDQDHEMIHIRGTKTTSSDRYIPIFPGIIFPDRNGDRLFPYTADYVTRQFHAVCPNHHLHDLRHTFASMCCEAGVELMVVQRWLGHADSSTTARIYTHVLPEFERTECQKLISVLSAGEKNV